MRYPLLTRSKTIRISRLLIEGKQPNWELERTWVGAGEDVSLEALQDVLARMKTEFENRPSRGIESSPEAFEGRFAGEVHRTLRDLPIEALDDPGFWRFLSLAHFWWFIAEREAGAIARGNVMTYVDGGGECVPFRMFIRAQAVRDGDDYSLAAAIPKGTDFWRSHVLRVKTATAPALTRSFARLQAERRMVSSDLRPFARRVNRLWSNVIFHVWDEDECDVLLADLHDEMESGTRHGGGLANP